MGIWELTVGYEAHILIFSYSHYPPWQIALVPIPMQVPPVLSAIPEEPDQLSIDRDSAKILARVGRVPFSARDPVGPSCANQLSPLTIAVPDGDHVVPATHGLDHHFAWL